jgi:hypothetical protein
VSTKIIPVAIYGKRKRNEMPGASRAPMSPTRRMLQSRVTHEQHAKANRAAEELGISTSALLAELVDRMRVDANGCPTWKSRYAPPADAETNPEADPMRLSA